MSKVDAVVTFLQNNYGRIQCFDTRNIVGDYMYTVYSDGGIQIDFCPGYYYVEIFGLTREEFREVEARVWINSSLSCRDWSL